MCARNLIERPRVSTALFEYKVHGWSHCLAFILNVHTESHVYMYIRAAQMWNAVCTPAIPYEQIDWDGIFFACVQKKYKIIYDKNK